MPTLLFCCKKMFVSKKRTRTARAGGSLPRVVRVGELTRLVPNGAPLKNEAATNRESDTGLLAVGGGDLERNRIALRAPVEGGCYGVGLDDSRIAEPLVLRRLDGAIARDELPTASQEEGADEEAEELGHDFLRK